MADEAATAKDGQFLLVSLLPDVCKTPGKKGKPIPYPIVHAMDQSAQCSPNVFFVGKPAFLHNESYVDNVKGDEPGKGGGVVSKVNTKISHSISHSATVFVNGQPIVRTGDRVWMNWKKPGPDVAAPADDGVSASGLGQSVDELIDKSPTLKNDLETFKTNGGQVKYGPKGGGSSLKTNPDGTQVIVLDGNRMNSPTDAVRSLSHELGHANSGFVPDTSSRSAFVDGYLGDEGAATMNNIRVQREILANTGGKVDIGISGNPANHAVYNEVYDQFLKNGNGAAARESIGEVFRHGETGSRGKLTYEQIYGGFYDKHYGIEP